MKPTLLLVIAMSAAACGKTEAPQAAAPAAPAAVETSTPTMTGTPEGYVNSLQRDVQKTQEVRDKANAASATAAEEMQKGLEGQ